MSGSSDEVAAVGAAVLWVTGACGLRGDGDGGWDRDGAHYRAATGAPRRRPDGDRRQDFH